MSDKVKKDIESTVDDLSEDEELLIYYDREQHERAVMNSALTAERIAKQELDNFKRKSKKELKIAKEKSYNEGIEKEKFEIAKNLLKQNVDISIIVSATGLSGKEINELKI